MKTHSVSIVVCAYNEERLLNSSLNSLSRLDYPKDSYEILIINDDSTDNTELIAKKFYEQHKDNLDITYRKIPHGGLSVARNQGIKIAKYELIAFIDGDAVADKQWLSELVLGITNSTRIGISGGIVENLDTDTEFGRFIHHFHYLPIKNTSDAQITDVIGTNMIYRAEVFNRLGGFYHAFDRRGDESTVNKLAVRSYSFSINPKAIVHHERPADISTWLEMRRQNGFYGYMSENVISVVQGKKGFLFKNIYILLNAVIHISFPLIFITSFLAPWKLGLILTIPGCLLYMKRYLISDRIRNVMERMRGFEEGSSLITFKAVLLYYIGSIYEEVGWIQATIKMPSAIITRNNI